MVLVGVTTWATIESRRPSVVTESDQSVREESPQDAAIELGGPNAAPDDMEERTAIAGASAEGIEGSATTQVIDETFGFGLLAWLAPVEGSWLRTSRNGMFDRRRDLGQDTFEVVAPGYHTKRVGAKDELGEFIRLEARSACSVLVSSAERGPVRSASVTWSPAPRDGEQPARNVFVTTVTGPEGTTSIAAASACEATVEAEGYPPRTVYVPVGETVEVLLSEGATVLTVVCGDTEQPKEGVQLRLTRPWDRNGVTWSAISDESGRIVLAGSDGPLEVELLGGAYWLHDRLPQGWIARNKIEATYVGEGDAAEAGGRELQLRIKCETIDVRLVHADTGGLIRGSVRYGYKTPKHDRHAVLYRLARQDCRDGVLRVRAINYETERINEPRIGGYELVVWPEGYQLENLGSLTSLRQGAAAVNEARFTPAKQRAVRIHDAAGWPVTGRFRVRSGDGRIIYHDGVGTEEGVYGPFDWCGGDLIVSRPRSNRWGGGLGSGSEFEEVATVSGEQIAVSEEVSIEVNLPVADVKVVRVEGRDAQVVVVDHAGVEHTAVSRSEAEIIFRGVPAGPVFIGPPAWARQLEERSIYGLGRESTQAPGGDTLVVPFDPEWQTTDDLPGQIQVLDTEALELFLMPVYRTTKVPMPMGLTSHWLPVRADGRYTIARGAPLPRALIVCSIINGTGQVASSADTGSFVVLDVIEPGGDIELHASPVELVWGGPDRADPATVRWSFTGQSYKHSDGFVLARHAPALGEVHWSDAQPRRFGPFPEGELELGCFIDTNWWTQTVPLTGDKVRVVTVGR